MKKFHKGFSLRKNLLLFAFCFLLVPKSNIATHIVGGEIYYDYLGSNNYKVTLKVYRDCYNGIPPLDNPAYVFIYNASGTMVQYLTMSNPVITLIPPTINNPCFTAPNNICVEEGIYISTVNLPPSVGGYTLVYQRCCRNNTILNMIQPGSVGSSYWCHIPGPDVVAVNNEPRFTYFPPIFICNGIQIDFNHIANDPDGDSLAYKLCDPFNGLDPCCPVLNPPAPPAPGGAQCPSPPPACPNNAPPPPYSTVPFVTPFNGNYPLSSNPAININVNTGWLSGVPNLNGQWVVGVCVEEWRNGVLIGIHHRDFQFNVVACPGLVVSAIQGQTTFCFGYMVNFSNQSVNGFGYLWNFGDPNTSADSSNSFQPTYIYPDTGNYSVTLIVNPYTPCADTSVQTFEIYPLLDPSFNTPAGQCITGNNFNFSSGGYFVGNGTFNWDFGPSASPSGSSLQNPTGITFSTAGTFPVSLTISENGCTETFLDSVEVYPLPQADFNATPLVGCVPYFVQFNDSSIHGTTISYLWDFGDGSFSSLSNPSHVYNNVGVYDVSLTIISTNGCIDTSTFTVPGMITTQPSPNAGFTGGPTPTSIFEPWVSFSDLSSNAVQWTYNFGDGTTDTTANPQHTFTSPGTFNVMQIVINEYGCPDTAYFPITILNEYRFWVPNAFTPFDENNINPIFKPIVYGVQNYSFMIFDRWGELIYETNDPKEGWDGYYKGKRCQQDIYIWKAVYVDVVQNLDHVHIGHVTLLK
ncbi:MAG: PKD domain-containing protein [Bacteroidota bacterium]